MRDGSKSEGRMGKNGRKSLEEEGVEIERGVEKEDGVGMEGRS